MLDVALSVKALSSVKSLQMTKKCAISALSKTTLDKKKKYSVPTAHLFLSFQLTKFTGFERSQGMKVS